MLCSVLQQLACGVHINWQSCLRSSSVLHVQVQVVYDTASPLIWKLLLHSILCICLVSYAAAITASLIHLVGNSPRLELPSWHGMVRHNSCGVWHGWCATA
jgi:hypothetical protein